MKGYSANEIRNVAILGHSGSGKTTLVEACLYAAEATKRMGRVEDGNTTSDYDPEEIRRKVSIQSSVIPVEWKENKINFIDTPGYFDFAGQIKEALAAADIALIVVSAKSGVEVGSELAWEYADELNLPKMIFINGMDDENADYDKVVAEMKEKFGKSIAPLQLPFEENGKFAGLINVVMNEAYRYSEGKAAQCDIPAGQEEHVKEMLLMIEEAVAETDDDLMEKFFNEERFTIEEIEAGLRAGLINHSVTPVYCGAATLSIGILGLLRGFVKGIPSAAVLRPEAVVKDIKTGEDITLACDEGGKPAAFVFKTIADPYVGRLSIFRVLSGIIKKDTPLYNPRKDFIEKPGHLYVMRGKEQIEVSELRAGDIGAIAKLQSVSTQDTLCTKEQPLSHPHIVYPGAYMSMAVAPKGKGDEDKLSQAFSKILEEDKTLKFYVDPETKQSVVTAVGDSQLSVLVEKLKNKYKLEADLHPPAFPYREMIKSKIKVQGKYKKQSGGSGQYGDVHIEFEPSGDIGAPYVFEEKVFGGAVPKQYFPAVEKGIQESIKSGPLAGYPVVGIKATLVDGSYHAVDSSEMAFKMATILAFKDGFMKAKPVLLEPIAKVEIIVPDAYTGDIMGDMNKRRGRILGMDKQKNKQKISAEAPMAEMIKYSTDLRSMTQGRGSFSMVFERYEEAPADIQNKIIEMRQKAKEK